MKLPPIQFSFGFAVQFATLLTVLLGCESCSSTNYIHQPPSFQETNQINTESEGHDVTLVMADSTYYYGHSLAMHRDTTEWVSDTTGRLAVATADILAINIHTPQVFAGVGFGLLLAPLFSLGAYEITHLVGASEDTQAEALFSGLAVGFGAGFSAGIAHQTSFDLSKPTAYVDSVLNATRK